MIITVYKNKTNTSLYMKLLYEIFIFNHLKDYDFKLTTYLRLLIMNTLQLRIKRLSKYQISNVK